MAIYTEDSNGKLTVVKPDVGLADSVAIIKEEQVKQGVEPSPCLVDTLGFAKKETTTIKEGV